MFKALDSFLNKITMYRLVFYVLIGLILIAMALGALGKVPFSPLEIFYSAVFFTFVCWVANEVFAWAFDAPANLESVYITAFILTLIVSPPKSADLGYLAFMGWAAVWAIAGKFILAIGKKHIFNPAALGVAMTALFAGMAASWWVGTAVMAPFVLVGGLLIVRKIRRADLAWAFFITATLTVCAFDAVAGFNIISALPKIFLDAPILFFGFIMLTEPLTTPPTKNLRIAYGILVGFLFAPQIHLTIGLNSFYLTPELVLLIGNVFAYIVSPKQKLILKLKEIVKLTPDTFDFVFTSPKQLAFAPGQYLEWTLGHEKTDSRGNRRYFTIASSPTEPDIKMGVKFYGAQSPSPVNSHGTSSFKKSLSGMKSGDTIVASQLAGDFTLPKNTNQKLAFIAGGIGVTPFRSMVKYLMDSKQQRDIVMLYSNKTINDIAYKNLFDEAATKINLKIIYALSDVGQLPGNWTGPTGYVSADVVKKYIPDFLDRHFYISGPQAMVTMTDETLRSLGLPESQIKKDFFPGFA
jgi:ferredoxin-NADP reductase